MTSNSSNAANAPVYDRASAREEQEAYDQLDPRIRAFIQQAPEKLSAAWALKMQRERGVEGLLRSGHEMLSRRYPGFKPI